jgi:hypothetical protein
MWIVKDVEQNRDLSQGTLHHSSLTSERNHENPKPRSISRRLKPDTFLETGDHYYTHRQYTNAV